MHWKSDTRRSRSREVRPALSQRVHASSRDEVGELARAFNRTAATLEMVDRHRRDLVANVSHELHTPIAALQAVLENLVDGVSNPGPDELRTALAQTERLGRLVGDLLDLSPERVGDDVQLAVADEGPGIAAADRSAVFERFTTSAAHSS
jgi:signal transduction histidine kinase